MTVRFYVAMIYGIAALGLAVFSQTLIGVADARETAPPASSASASAVAVSVILADDAIGRIPLAEIEPGITGHAEIDDLPAYLTDVPGARD